MSGIGTPDPKGPTPRVPQPDSVFLARETGRWRCGSGGGFWTVGGGLGARVDGWAGGDLSPPALLCPKLRVSILSSYGFCYSTCARRSKSFCGFDGMVRNPALDARNGGVQDCPLPRPVQIAVLDREVQKTLVPLIAATKAHTLIKGTAGGRDKVFRIVTGVFFDEAARALELFGNANLAVAYAASAGTLMARRSRGSSGRRNSTRPSSPRLRTRSD